jgi:hypothetical protein
VCGLLGMRYIDKIFNLGKKNGGKDIDKAFVEVYNTGRASYALHLIF